MEGSLATREPSIFLCAERWVNDIASDGTIIPATQTD